MNADANLETDGKSSEELREQRIVLQTLQKHPGWAIVLRCATYQQMQYQRRALQPLQSMDDVPSLEFAKGIAQGITEVLAVPEQVLEEIETELAARALRRPLSEGDEDGERADDPDDPDDT